MLDIKSPTITYRPMRPSDLEVLEEMHAALFPVRYEKQFFLNIVTGQGIISWAAVDISRPDGQSDELVGFVTTCVVAAKDSEIEDLLLGCDISRKDQTLVYILTLGVVEHYRNLGVATSLVRKVINYASRITKCTAVYLHVISYNHSAVHLYEKMLFKLVRSLPKFYDINGQHYDSYLFVYFVNGAQSPCSPLTLKVRHETVETTDTTNEKGPKPIPMLIVQTVVPRRIVAAVAAYIRGLYRSLHTKIWKNEKKLPRWSRCRETSSLLVTHNSRIVGL
ncbi:histone acetyltransferase MCC1-like isoform X3 [Iris pallida]|uniref:N-alpha-acetyltransferase 60 n=1 Tax=Iris pallida TaxID=29817 RepID=A0AAX6H0N1_IRIPA|nr:histone acetyltransferase MCC1-like isoform X3 [Iris pallida]